MPLFQAVQLGERYDLAIMSTKGMSVTAARTLIDALVADGVPVFCIRDFDVSRLHHRRHARPRHPAHTWRPPARSTSGSGSRMSEVRAGQGSVQHKRGKVLLTSRATILAASARTCDERCHRGRDRVPDP